MKLYKVCRISREIHGGETWVKPSLKTVVVMLGGVFSVSHVLFGYGVDAVSGMRVMNSEIVQC